MAHSYNLATILAVAIPLGVVALASILALFFILVRMSVVSARERRAYLIARNGEFQGRSVADAASSRSSLKALARTNAGLCDILCCAPTFEDLVPPRDAPSPRGEGDNYKKADYTRADRQAKAASSGAPRSDSPIQYDVLPTELQSQRSVQSGAQSSHRRRDDDLAKRTSAALDAAERRASHVSASRLERARSPPSFTPPKPPESPEPPTPPAPAMLRSSLNPSLRSREAEVEPSPAAALSTPRTSHASSGSPLFVPSIWSYPGSLNLSERLSLNASQVSQKSQQPKAEAKPGRLHSSEDRIKRLSDQRMLEAAIAEERPGTALAKQHKSGGGQESQSSLQRLLGPHYLDVSPQELEVDASQLYSDLDVPAKSALRSLRSPNASPASSTRGANHPPARDRKHSPTHSLAQGTPPRLQHASSAQSIYRTPPVAPLGIAPKAGSASSQRRLRTGESDALPSEYASIKTEAEPRPLRPRTPLSADNTSTDAATGRSESQRLDVNPNASQEAAHTDLPKPQGLASFEADAIDPSRQRILRLLKRDDSLHRGSELAYHQHVEVGRAAIASHAGSFVRDSSFPLLDAGLSLSADHINSLRAELDPTYIADRDLHNFTELGGPLMSEEEHHSSGVSFAPTTLDKLFSASSDSEMRLPLIDSSDESRSSRRSRRSRKERERDRLMSSPTSGNPRHSSRSSSLTASSTWATPSRISSANGADLLASAAADIGKSQPPKPPAVKTVSSIRNIASLMVPRTPRSPGYSPGNVGAQPQTPPQLGTATNELVNYPGRMLKRLSALGHGSGVGGIAQRSEPHLHNFSQFYNDQKRHTLQKQPKSLRARVPKNTRMNKPLPSMPHGAEDGLVTNLGGARYFVIQAYTRNLNDEISLVPGEIVKVYQVFDDGWCLVRADDDAIRKGICPHSCLKPLEN